MARDERFDIIKGFSIILVVLGHALNIEFLDDPWNCGLFNIIYCFHMPVFIFISGYFFHSSLQRNFIDVATSKFHRFILPSIFFSGLILLGYVFIVRFHNLSIRQIISISISYWYLICIYILSLSYYIALKDGRFACLRKTCVIGLFVLGLIAYYKYPIMQIIDCQTTRMFLCFGSGIIFRRRSHWFIGKIIPLMFFAILIIVANRYIYGYNLTLYSPLIRICDGLSWCLVMFTVLYYLASHVKYNFFTKHLIKVGNYSLSIYLVHMLFYNITLFLNIRIDKWSYISLIYFVFLYIITLFFIFLAKKYVSDKYKFLIGL